jgi:BirA family biotin operon repressor/biotin-[acetyl-CoA-carboxylase] ligase
MTRATVDPVDPPRRPAQPDLLDASQIFAALGTAARQSLSAINVVASIDSTNQCLLEAPAESVAEALLAEQQTAGRGRHGRVWRSPPGANLYLSVSGSFDRRPALAALPVAIGIRCAEALYGIGLEAIGVKWPNDLWIGNRKLGGILCESRQLPDGRLRVVTGLGLNIAMSEADGADIDQAWTSIQREWGREADPPGRNRIAALMITALVEAMLEFDREGFAAFARRWPRFDLSADQPLRIEGNDGWRAGIGRGIGGDGALRVEFDGEIETLRAGEVSLRLDSAVSR